MLLVANIEYDLTVDENHYEQPRQRDLLPHPAGVMMDLKLGS